MDTSLIPLNRTNWASLSVNNSACALSNTQSPIDITPNVTTAVAAGVLKMTFPTVNTTEFENIGTTIEVVMEGKGGSTVVDGKTYVLVFSFISFHHPSLCFSFGFLDKTSSGDGNEEKGGDE